VKKPEEKDCDETCMGYCGCEKDSYNEYKGGRK